MRRYPRTAALIMAAATAAAAAPADAVAQPGAPLPGARCRTAIRGSEATATCRNPAPSAVRVRLHIACARWWDPATDTRPVTIGPARTATVSGRCWKEVRSVWVTPG